MSIFGEIFLIAVLVFATYMLWFGLPKMFAKEEEARERKARLSYTKIAQLESELLDNEAP